MCVVVQEAVVAAVEPEPEPEPAPEEDPGTPHRTHTEHIQCATRDAVFGHHAHRQLEDARAL